MSILDTLIEEIKVDLGNDVVSVAISDETIKIKIREALRKISSYAPRRMVGTFSGNPIEMPEGTSCVVEILTADVASQATNPDPDVFSWSTMLMNSGSTMSDPFTMLMLQNQVETLRGFISLRDYYYVKETRQLYLTNNMQQRGSVVVRYLVPYTDIEQVMDEIVLQKVKEYSLALCKIIEGMIRRKFQNTPGSMQLDGDSLVSEGTSEKDKLDSELPQIFKYLRMGIRV